MNTKNTYNTAKLLPKTCMIMALGLVVLFMGFEKVIGQNSSHLEDDTLLVQLLTNQDESDEDLISVRFTNISLDKALEILAAEIRVGFSYNPEVMPDKEVSLSMSGVPPYEVLYKLLEGTNLEPVLPPSKDVIILKEKEEEMKPDVLQEVVRGTVVDAQTGETLPGVNIQIKETSSGTTTDANGQYELQVQSLDEILVFTYIGYQRLEVSIDNRNQIDVELTKSAVGLDQVVVTGTAAGARQREIGNVVGRIDAQQLELPSRNMDEMLSGRISGLSVTRTSSGMGSGSQIRLRGNTSPYLSNQPLIFIDGVRVSSEPYSPSTPIGGYQQPATQPSSPLNDISPQDIESIEIIKGASATTLYGSEASGGVIQIFTKSGIGTEPNWNLGIEQGITNVAPYGPSNAPYMNMENWLQNGHTQNYNLSLSQNIDERFRYFISGSIGNNTGVLPNDKQSKYNIRGNFELSPLDNLTINWNTSFMHNEITNTPSGNTPFSLALNALRYPSSVVNVEELQGLDAILDYDMQNTMDRFTTGATVEHTIKSISNKITVGYDRSTSNNREIQPYGFIGNPQGTISKRNWQREVISVDYVGTLRGSFSDQFRSTLYWGGQSVTTNEEQLGSYGTGFPGPHNHTISNAASSFSIEEMQRTVELGVFAQNIFDYNNRYFLTLGVRFDGNSVFGDDLGIQTYPKAGFSWVVSDEAFMDNVNIVSSLRLRAAYGWAGRSPGTFDALRTWQADFYKGNNAFIPANVGNPNLGPERSREMEVGLDADLLDNVVNIEFTYYDQNTTDAIFPVTQTPSTGFTGTQLMNVGEVANRGIEFSVGFLVVDTSQFSWNIGGNLATNRSEVISIAGARRIPVGRSGYIDEGQPVPVVWGHKIENPNEFAEPDITYDQYFGPNHPTHTIGFNTSFNYRDFILSARGEFMGGHYTTDRASELGIIRSTSYPLCVGPRELLDEGKRSELTARERALCDDSIMEVGMPRYPADFFRLRDVTLTAPLPADLLGVQRATFSASLQNWFSWINNDFLAFDPEMSGNFGMQEGMTYIMEEVPPPRSAIFSLRVQF